MSAVTDATRNLIAVPIAFVAIVATLFGWSPTPSTALIVAGLAAAVGMPHGALDIVVGPRLLPGRWFMVAYLMLGAATLALWFAAPLVALVAFLAMSLWHFGSGDAQHHAILGRHRHGIGAATAGLVIGVPLLTHGAVVRPIIDDLFGGRRDVSPGVVTSIGVVVCAVALLGFTASVGEIVRQKSWNVFVEVGILAALAVTVHPLVSFAIYFACWHSPRHVMTLDIDRRAIRPAILASAATFAMGAVVWMALSPSAAATTQVVFIGLSALTTPHLLITDLGRTTARIRRPIPASISLINPTTARIAGASTKA